MTPKQATLAASRRIIAAVTLIALKLTIGSWIWTLDLAGRNDCVDGCCFSAKPRSATPAPRTKIRLGGQNVESDTQADSKGCRSDGGRYLPWRNLWVNSARRCCDRADRRRMGWRCCQCDEADRNEAGPGDGELGAASGGFRRHSAQDQCNLAERRI